MVLHRTGALPLFESMMTELTGGACSHHAASMCLMVKEHVNIYLILDLGCAPVEITKVLTLMIVWRLEIFIQISQFRYSQVSSTFMLIMFMFFSL